MDEFSYELKLPKERIAVLIGQQGKIKKDIEETTKTKIEIDSKEGDVRVSGPDALFLFTAREIIRAIGRGFNPEFAMLLLKQDYSLEMLPIDDYCKTKNQFLRMKGRVIGKDGKSRKVIENITETYLSVYGKTVGIIGRAENVQIARRAVDQLLSGSQHSNVFKWLEKKRSEMNRTDFEAKKIGAEDIGRRSK